MRSGSRRAGRKILGKILPRNLNEKQIEKVTTALLEGSSTKSSSSSFRPYLKGVHSGRFYRINLSDAVKPKTSPLVKLPPPGGPVPHSFTKVPLSRSKTKLQNKKAIPDEDAYYTFNDYWILMRKWLKENWPTIVLNLGSIATLVGFTRSDVLELRILSVTGSMANVVYSFTRNPILYLPVCWSGTFASVNAVKIREIYNERHSFVHMTEEDEAIYNEFFMPHSVTPRQFQLLQETAEQVVIPKGGAIIRQGDKMTHVCLVVNGSTRASISGRRLTAASAISTKSKTDEESLNSGAYWIGEMTFLETFFKKEEKKRKTTKPPVKQSATPAEDNPTSQRQKLPSQTNANQEKKMAEKVEIDGNATPAKGVSVSATAGKEKDVPNSTTSADETPASPVCRYTIVAKDECVVWRWKFDEIEGLMNRSTDFRSALTRAMTSAIVSKVVSFTISKTSALPTWSTWLDHWKYNAGAKVTVRTDIDDEAVVEQIDQAEDDDDEIEEPAIV